MAGDSGKCSPFATDMFDLLQFDYCREQRNALAYCVPMTARDILTICLAQYLQRIYAILLLIHFKPG